MKPHWMDSIAAGAAFCVLVGALSFGLAKAEAAPLVIPGLGPEDQDLALRKRAKPVSPPVDAAASDAVTMQLAPQPSLPVKLPIEMAENAPRGGLGGGFIELLLTGRDPTPRVAVSPQRTPVGIPSPRFAAKQTAAMSVAPAAVIQKAMDPQFLRQEVDYSSRYSPGTIIIDTPQKFLFLIEGNGRALRYGIGVGRPGFEWSGVKTISRKAEWPGWTPPAEMLKRRPDLPLHMDGGPSNPLGARALYLGSSMYRIHGTNEPDTIGTNVSSGCIRMMNEDVTDLYEKVRVGTKVIVM